MSEPAALLQRLIRFDTTNPPGNERALVEYVAGLVREAGIDDVKLLGGDPERPNLVARLPGEGSAPPLLLQGHADVVPTEGQQWTHPPFEGTLVDGEVWGRGALDMKGGLAMMISAVLRRPRTAGDVILAVVADEERGSHAGARFLVEHHPELFAGVRYSLGEFGGFSNDAAGRRFYPIQVAEKQKCAIVATVRGPGGHGSMPMRGGTSARLARMLRALDRRRPPIHVTDVARRSVEAMAAALPAPAAVPVRALLNPRLTDATLRVLGEAGKPFEPALRNTVNAVIVRAGGSNNVVPAEATVELDCRILPGFGADDMLAEVRAIVGDEVELEVTRYDPAPTQAVDYGLFDLLAGALCEHDASGTPIPLLLPGITDGRVFGKLGIQHYGFVPLKLPKGMRFTELIHAADERVPVEALDFGAAAIGTVLERYGR